MKVNTIYLVLSCILLFSGVVVVVLLQPSISCSRLCLTNFSVEGNHIAFRLYYSDVPLAGSAVNITLNSAYRLTAIINKSGWIGEYAPLGLLGNSMAIQYSNSKSSIFFIYFGNYNQLLYIVFGVLVFIFISRASGIFEIDKVIITCPIVNEIGARQPVDSTKEGKVTRPFKCDEPYVFMGCSYLYDQGINRGRYKVRFTINDILKANMVILPQSLWINASIIEKGRKATVLFTTPYSESGFVSSLFCHQSAAKLFDMLTSSLKVDRCYI